MEFEIQHGMKYFATRQTNAACAAEPCAGAASKERAATPAAAVDAPMRSHPRWVKLEQAILKALLPFVEARDAVARALSNVEPEPELQSIG
jgi:hypothetical protein